MLRGFVLFHVTGAAAGAFLWFSGGSFGILDLFLQILKTNSESPEAHASSRLRSL